MDDDEYWDDESVARTRLRGDFTQYPVHAAVRDCDLAKLQALLAGAGHDINHEPHETTAPLMVAVICNNREAARMLLEAGADPLLLHKDCIGWYTPLDVAVIRGHDEMARLLWTATPPEKLAEYESGDARHDRCLGLAATYGRTSLLEFLLDGWLGGGVWDVKALEAALLDAVCSWRLHAATLLLDRVIYAPETLRRALFAAVDIKVILPWDIYDPVYVGVDFTNQELMVKRLLDAGPFDPNLCEWRPLIHCAVHEAKSIGALRALLAKGADPDARDETGRTPLQCIAKLTPGTQRESYGIHETGIRLLLEHGASVTAADHDGETPLHAAAFGADLHLFQLLLSKAGEGSHGANNHGETLLHYAAAGRNIGVVRFLLESAGADLQVNEVSSNGWTPLLCALVPMGEYWRTPVDDMVETAQLLLSYGADATAASDEGWSALHCLAGHKSHAGDTRFSALAEELIKKGAPLSDKARGLEEDWPFKRQWQDGFPWGFRMRRLMGKGMEGVFEEEGTSPVEWARRSKGKAVEEVLVTQGGQPRRLYSSFFYPANSKGQW